MSIRERNRAFWRSLRCSRCGRSGAGLNEATEASWMANTEVGEIVCPGCQTQEDIADWVIEQAICSVDVDSYEEGTR